MRIVEIRDCVREDSPIYYRRKFHGAALVESARGEICVNINFIIETSPLGTKKITIMPNAQVEFPVLEINKLIKKKIEELDEAGELPL